MKKIILRLDLNVPIKKERNADKILDTTRIDLVLNEIKKLSNKKKVVVLSHLGSGEPSDSLSVVEKYIRRKLNKKENENLFICENTRWIKGETAKAWSKDWFIASKHFASLGDEYIDDAFSCMHRDNASILGVPEIFKKEHKKIKIGENSKKEIKIINKFLKLIKNKKQKENKNLLILGGVKISTKLPLIKKFILLGGKVFLGGGIANQIFKEVLDFEIGKSFIEKDFTINKSLKNFFLKEIKNENIILPVDLILKNKNIILSEKIKKGDFVADLGPASFAILKKMISESKNIIMNGPFGLYQDGFTSGTLAILKELKKSSAEILIGGGDTLFLIKELKIKNKKNLYISSAGGAMLEFLIKDGKLPGITALKQNSK